MSSIFTIAWNNTRSPHSVLPKSRDSPTARTWSQGRRWLQTYRMLGKKRWPRQALVDRWEWSYSVGRDIKSQCPGEDRWKSSRKRQMWGTQEGRGAHSSPGNLPRTVQMPSPGLWDPPRDEGQERGWQGELREEKGAVSEASSALGLPSKKGPGAPSFLYQHAQCSVFNYRTENYREWKKEKPWSVSSQDLCS